jgi:anaerobic magnesium-protoporphyrin IX monomethyl ester cyclase
LKLHGIRACWFIQLGYPSETWEDVGMTRDLIRDEQPDDIGVSVSYPLPGTKFYDSVRSSLGAQHNWEHTGELAMLFQSTYTTAFYRELRDALHAQSRTRTPQDALAMDAEWEKLSHNQARHRSPQPFVTPGV